MPDRGAAAANPANAAERGLKHGISDHSDPLPVLYRQGWRRQNLDVVCHRAGSGRAGKKVLIVSTDPASNLDEVLGVALGQQPGPVPSVPGLRA